jgi:hypothetical protein
MEEWNGEEWLAFYKAVQAVKQRLSMSTGAAERTLREQCAGGGIRAIQYEAGAPPEYVKPKQWIDDPPDCDAYSLGVLEVSVDDLEYWLDHHPVKQQGGKQPRILRILQEMYPGRIPRPALCPRMALRADILKRDPSLDPLDEATLKTAIDTHNADPKRS